MENFFNHTILVSMITFGYMFVRMFYVLFLGNLSKTKELMASVFPVKMVLLASIVSMWILCFFFPKTMFYYVVFTLICEGVFLAYVKFMPDSLVGKIYKLSKDF